jgi:phage shock protein E
VTQVTEQYFSIAQFAASKLQTMEHILSVASIVDVRTPNEFEQGHYPGAVNIPLNELPQRLHEFKNMKQPIIVYCLSGARSSTAASILKHTGINEVCNAGGLNDILHYKR